MEDKETILKDERVSKVLTNLNEQPPKNIIYETSETVNNLVVTVET